MTTIVKTLQKENSEASRAEIHEREDGTFEVHYYSVGSSHRPYIEVYQDKSIYYAESAALNWLEGVKVLNG